eukprot:SAG31_NODE_241_length_19364_cov_17.168544_10_plen_326_part_00
MAVLMRQSSSSATDVGPLFMTLGCSLSAILVLQSIATEKEAHLLASLRIVGLREWTYWASWALCYFVPCLLSSVLSVVVGLVLNIQFFVNSDVAVQLLNMFLFLEAFAALATFLGAFISRTRMVVVISLVMLFVSLLSSTILTTMESSGRPYHYGPNSQWLVWLALSMMPWFHFQRVFADIAATTYQTDSKQDQYFDFRDLSNRRTQYMTVDEDHKFTLGYEYSTGTSLLVQLILVFVYNVGAWYVGQVVSAGEGSAQPLYFVLLPRYWREAAPPQRASPDADDTIGRERLASRTAQSLRCYKVRGYFLVFVLTIREIRDFYREM